MGDITPSENKAVGGGGGKADDDSAKIIPSLRVEAWELTKLASPIMFLKKAILLGGPLWQPEECLPKILPSGILGLQCTECELCQQGEVYLCLGRMDCSAITRVPISGQKQRYLHQQQSL